MTQWLLESDKFMTQKLRNQNKQNFTHVTHLVNKKNPWTELSYISALHYHILFLDHISRSTRYIIGLAKNWENVPFAFYWYVSVYLAIGLERKDTQNGDWPRLEQIAKNKNQKSFTHIITVVLKYFYLAFWGIYLLAGLQKCY